MKSISAWILCALGLVLATPRLLAQTSAVEEPFQAPRGIFLPCGAASAAEVARMRLRVELPPVPAYPPNGEIPEELQHRMVFLDEETGELVLSYPPEPDFEEPYPAQAVTGTRVVEKKSLGIASCPSVSVAIYHPGDPHTRGYVYRYRIHNLPQARKPIGQILLPVPLKQQQIPLSGLVQPYGWGVSDWELPQSGVEGHSEAMSYSWGEDFRQEVRQSMLRRRINWHALRVESRIERGKTLEPFGFTTLAGPGIVRAYIYGGPALIAKDMNWPEDLRGQLWAFNFTEVNSLSISTIGPKFSPDADRRLIALDFLSSLEELIRTGELAGDSPFIQKVIPLLETVAAGGGAVGADYWPSDPATDFQAEILMAFRLSLGD